MNTRAAAAKGAVMGPLLLSVSLGATEPMCAHASQSGAHADVRSGFEFVRIAHPRDALTFARDANAGAPRVIAVRSYEHDTVRGVDLSVLLGGAVSDPVALFVAEGYEPLRDRILAASPRDEVSVPVESLLLPVDLTESHIAAGTNYPEHAGEAEVTEGPFLFPKLVSPTPARAHVAAGSGLLDYEAELAWVTLQPVGRGARPPFFGLVLGNDYTDRATLLRGIDVRDVTSGKGFTTGKSFPGYLPVGNLFVIPRNAHAFVRDIELRLYVNGEVRQRSSVSQALWQLDELLVQTWDRSNTTWEHRGRHVRLTADRDVIPARTLILSGTPAGTIFQGIPLRQKLSGLAHWLFGGWGTSLPAHVIETYIRDASAQRTYLQPGDRVTVHVDLMGVIDNTIVH